MVSRQKSSFAQNLEPLQATNDQVEAHHISRASEWELGPKLLPFTTSIRHERFSLVGISYVPSCFVSAWSSRTTNYAPRWELPEGRPAVEVVFPAAAESQTRSAMRTAFAAETVIGVPDPTVIAVTAAGPLEHLIAARASTTQHATAPSEA